MIVKCWVVSSYRATFSASHRSPVVSELSTISLTFLRVGLQPRTKSRPWRKLILQGKSTFGGNGKCKVSGQRKVHRSCQHRKHKVRLHYQCFWCLKIYLLARLQQTKETLIILDGNSTGEASRSEMLMGENIFHALNINLIIVPNSQSTETLLIRY